MKMSLIAGMITLGVNAVVASASFAQVGLPTWRECDTYINWSTGVGMNTGNLLQMSGVPRQTWVCQAKGVNQQDYDNKYSFYDLSSGIAYDHSQYRCEREQGPCVVRCAFVPISCTPFRG